MRRHPSTGDDSLADGLGLDRMHPPAIAAFFLGLPRRVIDPLRRDEAESAAGGGEGHGDGAGAVEQDRPRTVITEEAVAAVTGVADAVEAAVERTKAIGFPVGPDAEVAEPDRPVLPAAVSTQLERVNTGAVEVAKRLSGMSSSAWASDADLLEDMRGAVLSITRPLRQLEQLADEDAVRRPVSRPEVDAGSATDPSGTSGGPAAHRSALTSNEAVPVDDEDIEAAREAIEIANDASTSPTVSAPPGTATPSCDS